jgi:PBP1b-binding outer membrane lipoprotein LpoB
MKNWIAVLLATLFMSGCGTDQYVTVQGTTTISKGQELTDLQRALNEGAITQTEFESLRARILKRPN